MKKLLFFVLAGAVALSAALAATSCKKLENAGELAELWVLIAEGELLNESHYTAESWAPFATALAEAERVAGSHAPTLEELRTAIANLHAAMNALVTAPVGAFVRPAATFAPAAAS
jgi:hypothetical protein